MISCNKLKIRKIKQFNIAEIDNVKGVYHGLWRFKDIIKSIRFTYRVPNNDIDINDLTPPKKSTNEKDYFQRLVSNERTLKIIDFLIAELKSEDSVITFPSSFIVSLHTSEIFDLKEYYQAVEYMDGEKIDKEFFGVFFDKDSDEIILPEIDLMLVVDGQHRLAALKVLYYTVLLNLNEELSDNIDEETFKVIKSCQRKLSNSKIDEFNTIKKYIEDFTLSCSLLLDFDIWEQGKVFADVNFNQKPVNRSLYYDIYGSYPNEDKNDIFLLHRWCVLLNSHENSKLRGKINLLGNGNGYISQAFLCDSLLPFMRKGGIWYNIANDFTLERLNDTSKLEKFLIAYFNSISLKFGNKKNGENYFWPDEFDLPRKFDSILLKTTGLGAMIDLIPNIYNLVRKELNNEQEVLENFILNIFNERLTRENLQAIYKDNPTKIEEINRKLTGEYYFSKSKGEFSAGAGKGLRSKLYRELMVDLNFSTIIIENQFSLFK